MHMPLQVAVATRITRPLYEPPNPRAEGVSGDVADVRLPPRPAPRLGVVAQVEGVDGFVVYAIFS